MPTESRLLTTPYSDWATLPELLARRETYNESDPDSVVRWEVFVSEGRKHTADRFRFILCSPSYDRLVGLTHSEMSGHTPYECLELHDAISIANKYEECITAQASITYSEYLTIGGPGRWWRTTIKPVWNERRIWKLIGFCAEISSIESELRTALDLGQLETWFQPICRLSSECVVADGPICEDGIAGYEGLSRWPGSGYSPNDYLPIAKAAGIIEEITKISIANGINAVRHFGKWVSVNISNCRFDEYLHNVTAASGIDPALLRFEITEDVLVDAALIERLTRVRGWGHVLKLDDFGTKNSNLELISVLNPVALKLDRQFVTGAYQNSHKSAMCSNAIALAKSLSPSLEVIAEGIETAADLEYMLRLGADYGQGYLFAKPMPLPAKEHP